MAARQHKPPTVKKSGAQTKKNSKSSATISNAAAVDDAQKNGVGTHKLSPASNRKYQAFLAQAAALANSAAAAAAASAATSISTASQISDQSANPAGEKDKRNSISDYTLQLQLTVLEHEARTVELRHAVGLRRLARANCLREFENEVVTAGYDALARHTHEYLAKLEAHGDGQIEEIEKIHNKFMSLY
ncbi:hypothetical protein D0Z00_002137 [Geotrichum galactomycetum]|uniref:Uncharacterized protein n=1 Tax=Geotrichum galactomycetum TaxID=27317 RepID=A0ACB6V502_9ASCO|nr:hypothetical protein D0Z00_002137 [Geotrichum candidum]